MKYNMVDYKICLGQEVVAVSCFTLNKKPGGIFSGSDDASVDSVCTSGVWEYTSSIYWHEQQSDFSKIFQRNII